MNKEETVIMKNRPILSRVILYSGVALIVALIIFLKLTCEDEQTKIKRWQHIKLLGNVLYYMYKQDGKLPSQKKYLTYFKSDLLDKNFIREMIFSTNILLTVGLLLMGETIESSFGISQNKHYIKLRLMKLK